MTDDNEIPLKADVLAAAGVLDQAQSLGNLRLIRDRIGAGTFDQLLPDMLSALRRSGDAWLRKVLS